MVKPREGLFSVAGLVENSRILDLLAVVVAPPWVVSGAAGIVVGRKAPGSLKIEEMLLSDPTRIYILSVTRFR